MARLARIVVPHAPHHVSQRGNGRQQTFFYPEDHVLHRDLLGHALARVHRACAGAIPAREQRSGHFRQGRFGAMDDAHLAAAQRYVVQSYGAPAAGARD